MIWHLVEIKQQKETKMLIATHEEKPDIMRMNVLQKGQHKMMCSVSPVKALSMCLEYDLAN